MIITVPDASAVEFPGAGPLKEILQQEDKKLLRRFIAARRDGDIVDFHTPLEEDARVELIPWDAPEAAAIFRHSLAHVMAQAVKKLFPEAQLAIGPSIEDGFYYDFDVPEPFSADDLQKIEKQMHRIVKQNQRFQRLEVGREEVFCNYFLLSFTRSYDIPLERAGFFGRCATCAGITFNVYVGLSIGFIIARGLT